MRSGLGPAGCHSAVGGGGVSNDLTNVSWVRWSSVLYWSLMLASTPAGLMDGSMSWMDFWYRLILFGVPFLMVLFRRLCTKNVFIPMFGASLFKIPSETGGAGSPLG